MKHLYGVRYEWPYLSVLVSMCAMRVLLCLLFFVVIAFAIPFSNVTISSAKSIRPSPNIWIDDYSMPAPVLPTSLDRQLEPYGSIEEALRKH